MSGPQPKKRAGSPVLVAGLVLVTMLVAYCSWYGSSFGRGLNDDQIFERLDPGVAPRDIQHALSQLEERLSPTYPGRERFREKVVELARSEHVEIRRQVAWVMGREPAPDYREGLVGLIDDADPGVRFNAGCSLSNFNDPRSRPPLLEALKPIPILAPATGTLELKTDEGEAASLGGGIGFVKTSEGEDVEVRTALNGVVLRLPLGKEGQVQKGAVIVTLEPNPKNVEGVLVALRAVGLEEDVPLIRPWAGSKTANWDDDDRERIASAARAAISAIESRGR